MDFQGQGECGFLPEEEIWTCGSCERGYFANSSGMSSCEPCDAGSYSSQTGSSQCEDCKPGSFSNRCESPVLLSS